MRAGRGDGVVGAWCIDDVCCEAGGNSEGLATLARDSRLGAWSDGAGPQPVSVASSASAKSALKSVERATGIVVAIGAIRSAGPAFLSLGDGTGVFTREEVTECKPGAGRKRRRVPGGLWINMGAPSVTSIGSGLAVDATLQASPLLCVKTILTGKPSSRDGTHHARAER